MTTGGIVKTQHGDVIVIMNQYAHVQNSKTIHSCIQLEAHGQLVEDRAVKVGGYQRIITKDNYVIPLHM